MVTRKPVPQNGGRLSADSNPPYPITPINTNNKEPFRMQDVHAQMAASASDSEPTSAQAWGGEGLDRDGKTGESRGIPDSLKVGPPGYTPATSQEKLNNTTNPFLQRQQTGLSDGRESSASAWGGFGERPAEPAVAPPPPPPHDPALTKQFASLSVAEPSTNPWQPALDQKSNTPAPIPQLQHEDSGKEVWSEANETQSTTVSKSDNSQQPVLIDIPEPESPAWDEDEASPVLPESSSNKLPVKGQIEDDRNVWDENGGPSHASAKTTFLPDTTQHDGWDMIDRDPIQSTGEQQSGVVTNDGAVLETYSTQDHEDAPALPPRRSLENPPAQPPRPVLPRDASSATSPAAKSQKKETYEIKKISWHDVNAAQNPRISPILVQNANGPCPLLALVNALTLSTPPNEETALIETLRSREQVSLGLLLDAVFDELMSGRRGDAAHELPDVGDLYSFLLALHTGMNVNPRFVPLPLTNEQRNSMSHVHPSEREAGVPGTFEETREMKLYSTFSIPLIHGWLPEKDSPAYIALSRSAKSYEDAQNIMFHEEGLEEKLQGEGLSFEEQGTLEDIATIKAFFATNATQLTPFGLQTITNSLAPGAVAILFRNDHFSTLYRHPDTLQLLQLVTDMGYAGHEEVVWESLIDVNGEHAEFFSGDFRLVGAGQSSPQTSNSPNQQRTSPQPQQSSNHPEPPLSPNTEQEDHDFALALQLQEEEEERDRTEIARRQRETELSQQYIEQQGSQTNTNISQNRNNQSSTRGSHPSPRGRGSIRGGSGGETRPIIPPRRNGPNAGGAPLDPEAGVEAPPPSYEQAANQAAYVPPSDHPAHPQRRMSAFSETSGGRRGGGLGRRQTLVDQIPGRRVNGGGAVNQGQGQGQEEVQRRDKDCVVM